MTKFNQNVGNIVNVFVKSGKSNLLKFWLGNFVNVHFHIPFIFKVIEIEKSRYKFYKTKFNSNFYFLARSI